GFCWSFRVVPMTRCGGGGGGGGGAPPPRHSRRLQGRASCRDDQDRAYRVVRDLAAHRTYQEFAEPPAAAGAHHEHVGVTRGVDEFFRRIPHAHVHRDLRNRPADFARGLFRELLHHSTFAVLGLAGPFGLASEHALRGRGRVRGNRGIWGGCDTRGDLTWCGDARGGGGETG